MRKGQRMAQVQGSKLEKNLKKNKSDPAKNA
jgi:hypothetical protein